MRKLLDNVGRMIVPAPPLKSPHRAIMDEVINQPLRIYAIRIILLRSLITVLVIAILFFLMGVSPYWPNLSGQGIVTGVSAGILVIGINFFVARGVSPIPSEASLSKYLKTSDSCGLVDNWMCALFKQVPLVMESRFKNDSRRRERVIREALQRLSSEPEKLDEDENWRSVADAIEAGRLDKEKLQQAVPKQAVVVDFVLILIIMLLAVLLGLTMSREGIGG